MKSVIFFAALFLTAIGMYAQDCKGFYYLDNSEVQMTMYDRKAKESGKVTYKISDVAKSGATTTANFTSEVVDEKGKSLSKGAGKYKCTGGVMLIDARLSLPQENMAAYKNMEVKADEAFIEYPSNLNAGQSLKDVDFTMSVWNQGAKFADISFKQANRKVEGKESVTSPAGTWECWKISFEGQFKAGIGPIAIPFNFKGTEWFAAGFGIVKTETYTKNGKLAGSTLITSVKK
jgi:hypothetical protein